MDAGADPVDIRGWQRLSASVTTSGRLEEQDPARLAALGVRHVINLALDEHPEALAGERERLEALGLGYTHIPVPFDAPAIEHYNRFRGALEAAEGPVHVHCIMNYRVSAFFYRLHIDRGMDADDAHAIMAQQWDPARSDNPLAAVWAAFVSSD